MNDLAAKVSGPKKRPRELTEKEKLDQLMRKWLPGL